MDINELICNMFEEVGVDIFYIHKPDGYEIDDYITFNFIINGAWSSNNDYEMDNYFITVNFITKNVGKLNTMINKFKKIVRNNEMCYAFSNRGTIFNKDSLEFFNASTFYLLVPTDINNINNDIEEEITK